MNNFEFTKSYINVNLMRDNMRDNYQQQLAQKLRNENKSFKEIGDIMSLSRHVAH